MNRTPHPALSNPAESLVPMGFAGARVLAAHGVTQAGILESRGPWRVRHRLRDHWLVFTERGESLWESGGAKFPLQRGQTWLAPAGAALDWICRRGLWRGFRIALARRGPSDRWAHLEGAAPREIGAGQAHRIMACIEGLFHEAHGPHYPDHAAMGGYFAGAIAIFLDRRLGVAAEGGAGAAWRRDLHDLWAHVAADLAGDWSVGRLAKRLGVSPPHLHRLCAKFYRETPHRVLLRMRMEAARSHLLEGRFTLEHIAALTGFSDAFALSKAFKRHFGGAPGRFREAWPGSAADGAMARERRR